MEKYYSIWDKIVWWWEDWANRSVVGWVTIVFVFAPLALVFFVVPFFIDYFLQKCINT